MRNTRWILPGAVALGAALLCAEPAARAWVLTGESLALDQRDVRVFDNFSDPEAHSNTTFDPSFPGWTGPYLAVWKALAEWGSELHLEGHGDPHQPDDLGSGGANFDASWQGAAPDTGGPDDNVMSEIAGLYPGVLAYTETPTGDGWRIRFYRSPWIWYDRPAGLTIGANQADLQGVATHEYGHALGLGHSGDPNATMYASAPSNEVLWRSIESDDRGGVQAIYGAKALDKPHVATYELLGGGLVLVRGAHFAPLGNRVWFTQAVQSADGVPITVSNVPSAQNGTELVVALPAGAGPGDLLVDNGGASADDLSNAFPFDPARGPCFLPRYYGSSRRNSSGEPAQIGYSNSPIAGATNFSINLYQAPTLQSAVLIFSSAASDYPFHGGRMLVGAPRWRAARLTIDSLGSASVTIPVTPALVGSTYCYQWWFADPTDAWHVGLSNALQVSYCP